MTPDHVRYSKSAQLPVRHDRSVVAWLLLQTGCALAAATSTPAGAAVHAPAGFTVSKFADDRLAHDIFAMTLDSQGSVVVSGPGYIKRLCDDDADGRADRAVLVSDLPASGAQGLCYLGHDLVFTGDGHLAVLRDRDADGVADGPPEPWLALANPEHGAHAMVQGPDGWLYLVCGNDAGAARLIYDNSRSRIARPECGVVLRMTTDGKAPHVVAHGFRNPYDLAFHAGGALFTDDADGERAEHLPWYEPTRVFDVGWGQHHGWVEDGWQNSWSRPERFCDNVARVCELGRGSPTGLECYRHQQFPAHYRGGLFSACWTLGRVYYLPLRPRGASYLALPEVFLTADSGDGFAPVDLAVGKQGELFVAVGGRGIAGAVFRVTYEPPEHTVATLAVDAEWPSPVERVLAAYQPTSAWSRTEWRALAEQQPSAVWSQAAKRADLAFEHRFRSIEVAVELGHKLAADDSLLNLVATPEELLARWVWAWGQGAVEFSSSELERAFWKHADALNSSMVMRARYEAVWQQGRFPGSDSHGALILKGGDDRSVSAATQTLWGYLAQSGVSIPQAHPTKDGSDIAIEYWQCRLCQQPGNLAQRVEAAQGVLPYLGAKQTAKQRLLAARLAQLVLGDLVSRSGPEGAWVGYQARDVGAIDIERRAQLASAASSGFPTGNRETDLELSRLLACLEVEPPLPWAAFDGLWNNTSSVADDVHYLLVLARLSGERSASITQATARALACLHHKLREAGAFPSRSWPQWVGDAFSELVRRDPALPAALVQEALFSLPEQSLFAERLSGAEREAVSVALWNRVSAATQPDCWTPEFVASLAAISPGQRLVAARQAAAVPTLEAAAMRLLAAHPENEDRGLFVAALGSLDDTLVRVAAEALTTLAVSPRGEELQAALRAGERRAWSCPLAQATAESQLAARRAQEKVGPAVAALDRLLAGWTQTARAALGETEPVTVWRETLAERRQAAARLFPDIISQARAAEEALAARWVNRDWNGGDAARGRVVFERQLCHRCHEGRDRLGPELLGIAQRLTLSDLLVSIVEPHREVSPTYRATTFVSRDGRAYHGVVVYESPEATLVQTSTTEVVRLAASEIEYQVPSAQSLMPAGLLDTIDDASVADLLAYLATLAVR